MQYLINIFSYILAKIDYAWGNLDLEDKENRNYLVGVIVLGFYYSFQLFLYRLPFEASSYFYELIGEQNRSIFERLLYNSQFFQLLGAIIGAVVGAGILIRHRKKNWRRFNSIRLVLSWSAGLIAGGVSLTIVLFYFNQNIENILFEFGMLLSRFLFGLGWACGIGCAVIWVCEYLPPHLRTSGALFIGVMGFFGAAILELLTFWVFQQHVSQYFLILISISGIVTIILSMSTCFYIPNDSSLNYSYDKKSEEPKESNLLILLGKVYAEKNYKRTVVFCLLIGCTVQYSTFFVKAYPQLACNEMTMDLSSSVKFEKQKNIIYGYCDCKVPEKQSIYQLTFQTSLHEIKGAKSLLQFFRYLGMIVGSILIIRLCSFHLLSYFGIKIKNYRFFRNKVTMLSYILVVNLIVMISISLAWWKAYNFIYDTLFFSSIFSFALGLVGASWILCILIVAEQFSLIDRIWWVLLAPNAYRVSEFILMLYTGGDIQVFGSNMSVAILILGFIFILIAILSSLGLNNNFEGDPLYLSNDKKLSSYDFIDSLQEISKSKKDSSLLTEINKTLWDYFKTLLRDQFFYSAIYELDSTSNHIRSLGVSENKIAFQIYCKKGEEVKNWTACQHISLAMMENNIEDSLVKTVIKANNNEMHGGLFWFSGKHFEIQPYTKLKYFIVDLHTIKVNNLKEHKEFLNGSSWEDPAQQQKLINHFSNIDCFIQDKSKDLDQTHLFKVSKAILKSFALFRIDAERYIPGRYFLHIIKPQIIDSQLALVLKTAVPLSEERLEELRAIITFIQLTVIRDNLEELRKDQEKTIARLSREEEHNRKAEMGWLKQNVRSLIARDIAPNPTEQFSELHGVCMKVIDHLYDVTAFNTYLLRWEAGDDDGNGSEEYYSKFVNLTACIDDIWSKIKEAYSFLRFSDPEHRFRFKQFAEQSNLFVDKKTVCLKNVPSIPLKIILFELLKNAAEKSSQNSPRVSLHLELLEGDKGLNIHIENSINLGVPIKLDQFDMNKSGHSGRAGIRSVKRYLGYINKQYNYNWELTPKKTDGTFEVTIHIPQICILD